jgi:predicted metal-dependent phosphoesterase TrpH
MLIDLHTHTQPLSLCSHLSLPELVARSRAAGLDGLCLTEHDAMWSVDDLARVTDATGFLLLRGIEVSTTQGHVLVYGLSRWRDIYGMEWSVHRLRKIADDQGAFLDKPHPLRDGDFTARADGSLLPGGEERLAFFDALEVLNGGESDAANALAAAIAHAYGLKGTAGGDVHAAAGVGRCATRFARAIRSESELVAELRAGRFTTVDLRLSVKT